MYKYIIMKQTNYASFILDESEQNTKREQEIKRNTKRQQLIKSIVKTNGLIELKCDYFGMDSYYYDVLRKNMYKICNVCDDWRDINPTFEISTDEHILKLNSLF